MFMRGTMGLLKDSAFTIAMPVLDPWQAAHMITWSKVRLFLLHFRYHHTHKHQIHFGFMAIPSIVLLLLPLVSFDALAGM
jgi:hypothetical protein